MSSYQIPPGIVVFGASKGQCPKCDDLKLKLTNEKIEFSFVDVRENEDAANYLRRLGFRSIPIMFKDGQHVSQLNG